MTHIMAREIIDNDGDCSRHEAVLLAKAWLAAHPETHSPETRRYEIAAGVLKSFARSNEDASGFSGKEMAKRAVEWADALIAELDKTEAEK